MPEPMKQQIKLVAKRITNNHFHPGRPQDPVARKPRGGFFTLLGALVWMFVIYQLLK